MIVGPDLRAVVVDSPDTGLWSPSPCKLAEPPSVADRQHLTGDLPGAGEDPQTALGPEVLCFRHVAFRVDRENFERARETLRSRAIELELHDHRASLSIYFRDPDGHQIEITTYEV